MVQVARAVVVMRVMRVGRCMLVFLLAGAMKR